MITYYTNEIGAFRMRFIILYLFLAGSSAHSTEFYVSPEGLDSNSGTEQAPFATIERALNGVKEVFHSSPDENCTIWLEQGVYRINDPLNFRAEEFLNHKASLTISGMPGTQPTISGGMDIKQWKPISGGMWKARSPVKVTDHQSCRELFINDRRAIRARFPNEGYLRVDRVGEDRRTFFYFEDGDFPLPSNTGNTELILLHDWSISRIPIKDIDSLERRLTTIDSIGARQPDFFNLDHWEPHPRYFLENDLRFIDLDYEWYYDKKENSFYLQLPSGVDPNDMETVIPVSRGLVMLNGNMNMPIKNIRFKDLIFEHSAWLIPAEGYAGIQACSYDPRPGNYGWKIVEAAVKGEWVINSSFTDCTFRHLGGSGLWLSSGSKNNNITKCDFFDISGNGIMIGEGKDREVNGRYWWKEVPEQVVLGNTIEKSKVTNCGVQFFGAVGIWCGLTAKTTIRYNEIYGLPYTGISIGWMWSPVPTPCRDNILSGNHIHHVMQKLSDGGGIYMLGLQPGSKLLNNMIHDVHLNAGRAESNGMFLDEGATDLLIADNVIYGIAKSPLRFHKATTNLVKNNFLFCGKGVPSIRYNSTEEKDIVKENNRILTEGEQKYVKYLQKAIVEWENRKR